MPRKSRTDGDGRKLRRVPAYLPKDREPGPPDEEEIYPGDLILTGCARCSCRLTAPGQSDVPPHAPPVVAGRVYGRPYCERCYPVVRRSCPPLPPHTTWCRGDGS